MSLRPSASVIASSVEQTDRDQIGNQEPLRRLPRIGELQMPGGGGISPPHNLFCLIWNRICRPLRTTNNIILTVTRH